MTPWESLPEDARLWIYQSNRLLSEEDCNHIQSKGKAFIEQWTAHGAKMSASLQIVHHAFVLICADETAAKASGCSIDASVHFIQALGKQLQIDFFNRLNVAYFKDEKVYFSHVSEVPGLIDKGQMSLETCIFNNLISKKSQLSNDWQIPLKKSWLAAQV